MTSRVIGFAHRGARAHAPENTLAAFALALELGARGLESDVWLTRDGEAVLDHDGIVRAPDGTERPIATCLRRELPAHVPTLVELYAELGRDFELSLDLKDETATAATLAVARAAGAVGRLWLCHWNWRTVARIREHAPDVRLVDSTRALHMRTPPSERGQRMRALGIDVLNLPWADWTPDAVEAMHAEGRLAFGWDAQTREALDRALALGLDGIYSDHVDRMLEALAKRA